MTIYMQTRLILECICGIYSFGWTRNDTLFHLWCAQEVEHIEPEIEVQCHVLVLITRSMCTKICFFI